MRQSYMVASDRGQRILGALSTACEVYKVGNVFVFTVRFRGASNYCGKSCSVCEKRLTAVRDVSKNNNVSFC